jgi:hypothetical protein
MLNSLSKVACAVFACLAITSMASGAVQYGVVGGGIHVQYGPQDTGGNFMGIASESYDPWADGGQWDTVFPAGGTSPNTWPTDPDATGYVLLALNPYTGEVWTDVPLTHQAHNPAGTYSGHGQGTMISGPSGLPDDPGTPGVDESLVYSDWVSNLTPSATGYAQDCIYVTGEIYLDGQYQFGTFVTASPDGGILGDAYYDPGDHIQMSVGQAVDTSSGVFIDDVIGLIGTAYVTGGYSGTWGSSVGKIGFEMDGIKGWLRFDYSGSRTGVRLTEYYFDLVANGDFDGDGDIDGDDVDILCANMGGDVATYDMDGDGDVDEDDMTFHVENYLEYDTNGDGVVDGTGTFRGDFNTDGTVNGTDLSIMSGGFGTTTGFAGGNANCDATVNGTDLSILSSVFGSVATAAVPEPLTLGLLGLGGLAILKRRK